MELTIKNKNELDLWIHECISNGHDLEAVTGKAPDQATYSDGTPIIRPVNIQWRDCSTGSVCDVIYSN